MMLKKFSFVVSLMLLSLVGFAVELDEKDLQSAFRPTFITTEGDRTAGTAFVVGYEGGFFAVTAYHLLGEAGGLSRDYAWDEVFEVVYEVSLQSLSDENTQYIAPSQVMIVGAKGLSFWTAKNDIAVFRMLDKPTHYLKLADEHPKVGDLVWLYADVIGGSDALLHKAVVEQYDRDSMLYGFINKKLSLNGSSGAAMLNAKGEVVGINVVVEKKMAGPMVKPIH
ncbi:trypsin-like peptidase domain-containing protein [Marinicella sp. W31]|uniref:trypsin-like peptidase domain-containing protein n=1 Tax=Marinicella sp. W31 TaxID=3023713 RepID=UPI0037564A61